MAKPITEKLKQLDNGNYLNSSGEELKAREYLSVLVPRKIKWTRGDYMLSFQNGLKEIAKMGLTGEQWSVLSLLMAKTDFENYINITQKELSEELTIPQPHISRAIKVLIDRKIIKKMKKGTSNYYMFNPEISFKGKSKNYGNVYQLFNKEPEETKI